MAEHQIPTDTGHVAVVVVHGVGLHQPDDSAREGADLLSEFCPDDYNSFAEDRVRMKVERLAAPRADAPDDIAFSGERLKKYHPAAGSHSADRTYATLRLRARRKAGQGRKACEVHVHEMAWSNLSRVTGGGIRWLSEIYDLTFLVNRVGGQAIEAATRRADHKRAWTWLGHLHWAANIILNKIILSLNACLLCMGVPLLLVRLPERLWSVTLTIIVGLVTAGLLVWVQRKSIGRNYLLLGVTAVASLAAAFLGHYVYVHGGVTVGGSAGKAVRLSYMVAFGPMLLAWVIAPATWFALWQLLVLKWSEHAEDKPATHKLATGIPCLLALFFLLSQYWISPQASTAVHFDWLIDRTLRAAEGIYLLMIVVWSILVIVTLAALIFAWVGFGRGLDAAGRRARWTACISIFMPIIGIILLNLTLWSSVNAALPVILGSGKDFTEDSSATPGKVQPNSSAANQQPQAATADKPEGNALTRTFHNPLFTNEAGGWRLKMQEFIKATVGPAYDLKPSSAAETIQDLVQATSSEIINMLILLLLGAGVSVWGLAKSIQAEGALPKTRGEDHLQEPKTSREYGGMIDRLFPALLSIGKIICVGTLVSLIYPVLGKFIPALKDFHDWMRQHAEPIQYMLGGVALALLMGRGPFSWLMLGLRGAIDVGLDVMNWLRKAPLQAPPRARIMCRMAALLKYLSEWESETGARYDRIVILAHSQGTVISAETLRYLNHLGALPRQEIFLFTMGCPLRQLYALRFPHLYSWVNDSHGANQIGPDPQATGVGRWWNYYRSGDYVGRHLFWDQSKDEEKDKGQLANDGRYEPGVVHRYGDFVQECCIGAGAHTHYWDSFGKSIAKALDELVTMPEDAPRPQSVLS